MVLAGAGVAGCCSGDQGEGRSATGTEQERTFKCELRGSGGGSSPSNGEQVLVEGSRATRRTEASQSGPAWPDDTDRFSTVLMLQLLLLLILVMLRQCRRCLRQQAVFDYPLTPQWKATGNH